MHPAIKTNSKFVAPRPTPMSVPVVPVQTHRPLHPKAIISPDFPRSQHANTDVSIEMNWNVPKQASFPLTTYAHPTARANLTHTRMHAPRTFTRGARAFRRASAPCAGAPRSPWPWAVWSVLYPKKVLISVHCPNCPYLWAREPRTVLSGAVRTSPPQHPLLSDGLSVPSKSVFRT